MTAGGRAGDKKLGRMLRDYDKDIKPEEWVGIVCRAKGMSRTEARRFLQRGTPEEGYFQKKIMEALKKAYPDALVLKVAQGFFSEKGVPDIMCVIEGHYFGIEVKRPLFGDRELKGNQKAFAERVRKAGGTAIMASYPEEVLREIGAFLGGRP